MLETKLLLFFLLPALMAAAQQYQVQGKVTNTQLEPLAFVSVQVKGSSKGVVTKQDGTYLLTLEEGQYQIVFSMIGYTPQTITLAVTRNSTQNIILQEETGINMDEVVVKGKAKDRAAEIMRLVIQHKEQHGNAAGAYSTRLYIKAVQQDSLVRKKPKQALTDSLKAKNNFPITKQTN